MTRPASLPRVDQAQLEAILRTCPELAAVTTHIRAFAAMMTSRGGSGLGNWMTGAASSDPALRSFVTGLRSDQDAVTAGLTLPWSSGAVEGHVNASRCSSARCTDAPAPTCSPTNKQPHHANCARE